MVVVAEEVVVIARQEERAPAAHIAWHPREAACRVERIVEVGQIENGNLVEMEPGITHNNMIAWSILDLARHIPVCLANIIRARRHTRLARERDATSGVALKTFAAQGEDTHLRLDMPRRARGLRHMIDGDLIGLERETLFGCTIRLGVNRLRARRREGEKADDEEEGVFHHDCE